MLTSGRLYDIPQLKVPHWKQHSCGSSSCFKSCCSSRFKSKTTTPSWRVPQLQPVEVLAIALGKTHPTPYVLSDTEWPQKSMQTSIKVWVHYSLMYAQIQWSNDSSTSHISWVDWNIFYPKRRWCLEYHLIVKSSKHVHLLGQSEIQLSWFIPN